MIAAASAAIRTSNAAASFMWVARGGSRGHHAHPGTRRFAKGRCPTGAGRAAPSAMLDLPDHSTACLFDLDGVLTQTASLHAQAWKEMFDAFLHEWSERTGEPFHEFDRPTDYDEYVDGKPRLDGVTSFLRSRGIDLPLGSPSDPVDAQTVHGLARRKNDRVLELMKEQGIDAYEGSVAFVKAAQE